MPNLSCSLIITTYNWPEALRKCLQSIVWQTRRPDEIIIADDGSNDKTREMITALQENYPIPLKHLWHEDKKKRKTRINNKAIIASSAEYLIFIDHDIILHPQFIQDHLTISEKGYFINGSRFLADEASTNRLLEKENINKNDLKLLKGKNALNKIRIPFLMNFLAHRYQTKDKDNFDVRGCNMSFWKKDLILVNGYDEAYQGWGREDSNIAARLFNNGIRKKSLKFGGIAFHLEHPYSNKTDDDIYMKMLTETINNKEKWTKNGLDQHY